MNGRFRENRILAFVYGNGINDFTGQAVNKGSGVGVDILVFSVLKEPYGSVGTVCALKDIEACAEAGG